MMSDNEPPYDVTERTVAYALRIIKLYRHIQNDSVGRILGKQLLRSGTSVGANVHEAQGAQSRADFIAKLSIAQKEIIETGYWLRLLAEAQIVPEDRISMLRDETEQLTKILSTILINSKKSATRKR
jgi:four helix bundle protein